MGAIIKLFRKSSHDLDEEDKTNKQVKKEEPKVIKIHICGNGERKKKVVNFLFKSKISSADLQSKGDTEYKSSDFYWITKIYEDEVLTEEKCNQIEENIENDKAAKIKYHIMLLFGDDNNIQMILEEFSDIHRPRIIFVSNKKTNIEESNKKKYVTNIACEGMDDKELNSYIVSTLWELDCYYNEKGNEIFRHTPVNIVKGLQTDNSFFTINILLTGMCRAGKSSFINLLAGKLIALETNDTESVTLKISEYYIYKDENNKDNGGLKLIDTPGICENEHINSETKKIINEFITNKEQKIEKQIHFVLFFFMEQSTLGHSEELLQILNKSKYPVFFIINKSQDKTWKGKSQDIKSKISYLKKGGYENLAKVENFIQVNLKSSSGPFYGVNDIFKKIEKYIVDNNLLDNNILKTMKDYQKEYRHYQNNNLFSEDFNKRLDMKEKTDPVYDQFKNNILFKNIHIDNMKAHGRKISQKYEKNIILLSNLKNVFPERIKNIPMISFLQAFMIKEIGAGYGFDFNSVNYSFLKFYKDINKLKLKLDEYKEEEKVPEKKSDEEEMIKIYKKEEIEKQKEELNFRIYDIWNSSNKQVIERLVKIIHELTLKGKNEIQDENEFNIQNTKAISSLCQKYFEDELRSSCGLTFLIYYFEKNAKLMEDIKYYIDKQDWEKDELEIKEKKRTLYEIID